MDVTARVWPISVRCTIPVCESHSMTLFSESPEANVLPSGENVTQLMPLLDLTVKGVSVPSKAPDRVFHNLIVASELPEASILPSGENAQVTLPLCPCQGSVQTSRFSVPQLDRFVCTARSQHTAVRRERDPEYVKRVSFEHR